ncbi:MAG: hypothetical protein HPY85_15295 [Anaerolineae bacterium]|nr:hypothetical protein [Anaerolineae bacterium]
MDSRTRILKTIRHEAVDRVPISTYELCAFQPANFENQAPSYTALMNLIRESTDAITMWNPSSDQHMALSAHPAVVSEVVERRDGITIRRARLETPAGRTLTSTDQAYDDVHTVWHTEHWCKSSADVDALLSIPYTPVSYDFSELGAITNTMGNRGIVMTSLADPACTAMELMEFGAATVWAMTETDHFAAVMEELHRRTMQNLKCMLEGGVADLYRICGPEYLTPPYLPPAFFERFVVPYDAEMTELIHSCGGLVRVHSHGKIRRVVDLIRKIGADGLDPCEAPPDGDIELWELKQRLGSELCLFGNLQLKLLEHGSTDEVRAAVQGCMDAAKHGGGFVIMPTASPINVPLSPKTEENYRVFIESALTLGRY